MKYMTTKAKMMVAGTMIGAASAFLMAGLVVSGRIGWAGVLAVIALAVFAGLTGMIVGLQMRVELERHKVWLVGYKDGCRSTLDSIRRDNRFALVREESVLYAGQELPKAYGSWYSAAMREGEQEWKN